MEKIAIVGSGLIGQSWAIAFARGGCSVSLHDRDPETNAAAMAAIPGALEALAALDLLAGQEAAEIAARIRPANDLAAAVSGASHVQENAPEDPHLKRALFAQLDAIAAPEAVIASSTSALLPSSLTEGLSGAHRCLVAHPLNPPHLIPAVEIVPGPQTTPAAVARTRALMTAIGQSPIETTREVEGFVMNRLQGAILDEAFSLVERGLASPGDIDTALRDGLARRWIFMGPFETIDLNAPGGIADFMDRYGPAYAAIGRERPNRPVWQGRVREQLVAHRAKALAPANRAARVKWRDRRLAQLSRLISAIEKEPE